MPGRALVNAHVRPMTTPDAHSDAIAWKDGKIIAVGDAAVRAAAAEHGLPLEDLGGRVVLPGFVDAHMHFLHVGIKALRPDLTGARDRRECLDRARDWLTGHPGDDPVIGEGWDESRWPDRRHPTRDELDGLTDRPLVLRRIDGHIAIANTPAAALCAARWPALVDRETGVLLEDASLYLNEALPTADADLDRAVEEACQVAHTFGVTAVGDYSQAPYREALLRAADRGALSVRVASSMYVQQLDDALASGFRTGRRHGDGSWLRDSGLKVFHDGSLGGHTAWLHAPYEDDEGAGPDGCGTPIWDDAEMMGAYGRAHRGGIQLHAHAIGDAAIDQALDGMEAIGPEGIQTLRHRIEHFELPTDEAVARTRRLGLVGCCQPNFVGAWSAKGGMYEERLGKRFWRNNRYRSWLEQGLLLAFGSDGMPFGPLYGIQSALDHPVPEERITAEEAVWLYTARAAWSLHWDDAIGTLEASKRADLLILDQTDLERTRPTGWVFLEVVVDGKTLHRTKSRRIQV